MNMHKITPEYLTEYVNFHFTNENWKYNKNENLNTAKIQAEGAAKIFNLLIDNHIALLSDEVGMGKTYEALAVMVSLWRQKPNAKILLYAPNEIVALKWITDYHNFIRKNFKLTDDLIKSSLNKEPLHKAVYCHNQIELLEQINKKWVSFYVCKTSSLSGLLSPKINNGSLNRLGIDLTLDIDQDSSDEEKMVWMYKLAKKFNEKTYTKLAENDKPPFDLLIFDEAHYLRRTEPSSGSNRSIVAHAFFAGRNIKGERPYELYMPIASKVLLMTATPTHSSNEDVRTIVSLFNPDFKDKKPGEILKEICVRRFRRLENKTKYEYREEMPEDVEIKTLRERLFFAAYQKSLVLNKARAAKAGKVRQNNAYRILFGYLEGFEFISGNDGYRKNAAAPKKEEDQQNKKDTLNGDFEFTDDSTIIKELSEKYLKAYRSNPAHPKYEKIISDLLPFDSKIESLDKKLVFVRRIPSVNEISNRLVAEYDKRFKEVLKQIVGAKRINKINLRKFFYNIGKNEEEIELQPEEMNNEEDESVTGVPKSKILNLFTVKKEGKYKTTDCSNFRLRFLKDEQIFSVFFQPALDYQSAPYEISGFITKKQNDKNRRLYQSTIKTYRKEKIQEYSKKLKIGIGYNLDDLEKYDGKTIVLDTLIGIWLRNNHCDEYCKTAQNEYLNNFSLFEKEGLSSYLEAGILFSSYPFLKWLYHKVLCVLL